MATTRQVEVKGPATARGREVLSAEALDFVARLQGEFGDRRLELLRSRDERQKRIDAGESPDFLAATRSVRESDWKVASIPHDLRDRRVEITGPTDAKMLINALNSGARVFMADFEDANSPTWTNLVDGQANLTDAIERRLEFTSPEGKEYRLNEKVATLLVRPRGWHLEERHVEVGGKPMSGSLFDFGMYFFRNAQRLLDKGSGPYFYLPKIESHLEARLWNDVFEFAQDALKIPRGTIRATVLIETILAAFEMEEILYELRTHSSGLNAGRWDYIFSIIKKFRNRQDFVLPDRAQVTMTVPFMRAYTELLVKTCHKHGAHAMGGMAAFIPSRRDAEVNGVAMAKVKEDKDREAGDGFDGTWVAHPGSRRDRYRVVRSRAGRSPEPDRAAAARGVGQRVTAARRAGAGRNDHRGWAAPQRQRGHPVHRVVAARRWRGGDQQPDGGRRHRGDIAVAGVAVDPSLGASRATARSSPTTWRARSLTKS